MEVKEKAYDILKNIAYQSGGIFSGLYKGENPLVIFSSLGKKESVVKELVGLLVRKAILSSNELIEGFLPEFLFAEGKDFAIYIYVLQDNIAIATVVNSKPNFSLIKFNHEKASEELKPLIYDINQLEKLQEIQEEKAKEIGTSEEISDKVTGEEKLEDKIEKTTELESPIEDLESILSQETPEEETTESLEKEDTQQEIIEPEKTQKEIQEENIIDEEVPGLEEILSAETQEDEEYQDYEKEEFIENIQDVLDKLLSAYIKEIGPIGKILFNKLLNSFDIESKPTKSNLDKFVNQLLEEIPSEERREKFLKDIETIIGGQ